MNWLISGGFTGLFILFTFAAVYTLKSKRKNNYTIATDVGYSGLALFTIAAQILFYID